MNTISSVGQSLAMDGRFNMNPQAAVKGSANVVHAAAPVPIKGAAEVVDNITNNIAQLKEDVMEIQKLSNVVMGRKVQFNVNKELDQVIVTIVDPATNQVVKQIPSEDVQRLKVRIRKTIGLLYKDAAV